MQRDAILNLSILGLRDAFSDGVLSCVEVAEAYLAQIRTDASRPYPLNAVTCLDPDVLHRARLLDQARNQGRPLGLLHGVPILVKDNIDVAGLPTSNGSRLLAGARPRANAAIVDNLLAEGAVILGKASMGEFAHGHYSSRDGTVRNPFHPKRSPAGSSCGSAVAVAARYALAAIGTDSSNSVRGPAAMAGIVGMRPTTRLLDRRGIAPKSRAFDTAGPMARTVKDAALILEAMKATREGRSADVADAVSGGTLTAIRLGVVGTFFRGDREVLGLAEKALSALERSGAVLVDISIDEDHVGRFIDDSGRTIRNPADASFREDFDAYLSTLSGDHQPACVADIVAACEEPGAAAGRPVDEAIVAFLRRSLSRSSTDEDYIRLVNESLPRLTSFKCELFERHGVDAMIYPTKAAFASPLDTPEIRIDDESYIPTGVSWENPLVFASYDSIGNPDITIPIGLGHLGMPAGLSIMGKPYEDERLLSIAARVETAIAA